MNRTLESVKAKIVSVIKTARKEEFEKAMQLPKEELAMTLSKSKVARGLNGLYRLNGIDQDGYIIVVGSGGAQGRKIANAQVPVIHILEEDLQ